jgi:hypothetical protein
METKPILRFENEAELRKCMLWWKERLFLHDWSIVVHLAEEVFDENNYECAGNNEFQLLHMTSVITISTKEDGIKSTTTVSKVCHEKTLVHELLHLKYNWLLAPSSHEGMYFDALEHQKLEQMARSLVLAKYQLPADWFDQSEAQQEGVDDVTHTEKNPQD